MKKLKYGVFILLLVCSCFFMSACDFFMNGPRVEKFQVEYTENLKFLVGEDYKDDLVKGTAIFSDDSTKDVTDTMKIDTSNYDKTQAGTYKIKFSYEGAKVDYEVEVVNAITDSADITNRMLNVAENTFEKVNDVLSFEATNSFDMSGKNFVEDLIYVDNNGQISAYVSWTVENELFMEFHFNGTTDNGEITILGFEGKNVLEYENKTLDEFSTIILYSAEESLIPAVLSPSSVLALNSPSYAGELTLNNGVYTFTFEGHSLQYKNNTIISMDGASLTFPKKSTTIIPEFTSIQEIMDPVIENTYVRNNGKLEISAYDVLYYQSDLMITQEFVIQEDNGSYLIYNQFYIMAGSLSESYQYWFEGTLDNGTLILKINDGQNVNVVPEYNVDINVFMEAIVAFQEGFNEEGLDLQIKLLPSHMIYLEHSDFSGELSVDVFSTLTQEVAEGVDFVLQYYESVITSVNNVLVEFSDSFTSYIPAIPSVN